MTLKRRALFVFIASILLACAACSPASNPASNNNTAAGNANVANRPAANANTANANAAPKSKPGTGSIEIVSLPAGAGITLVPPSPATPQAYGATPATINDLAPGTYTVSLSKTGYKNFQQEVEVKPDAAVRVKAALRR